MRACGTGALPLSQRWRVARVIRSGRLLVGGDVTDVESPAGWTPDRLNAFEDAVDDYRHLDLEAAQRKPFVRLKHFRDQIRTRLSGLNPIETFVNFAAQRWWPLRPGKHGVTRFEVVAGYSTTYGTLVDSEAQAMSAAEFGVRIYNWGFDPDPDGVRQALTPRYWTVALAAASDRDGALRVPWSTGTRYGPLVSWGDFKVVYLHGKDEKWRLMVSRQIQLLPHLF